MKKLKLKNSPYIVKNKNYSTLEFRLIFPVEYKKENLFNKRLAGQIVLNSSYKYKTEKEYINKKRSLLIINLSMNIFRDGDKEFVSFNLIVPDPKKIKSFNLEEAFKFFIDTIYKPNIINNEFNHDRFNREKGYLKKQIEDQNDNHNTKAFNEFLDIYDSRGDLKENMYHNMDLIEKSNPKELYQIYKETIIDNKPIIFVYGNIDENINDLISKYIKFDNKEITIPITTTKPYKPFNKIKEVNTKSEYNQSFLYIGYKMKTMKKIYEHYLVLLKNILGNGTNNLVHNVLRYEYKLLYYRYIGFGEKTGTLYIELSIENDKKDIALKGIDEIFKRLHNKQYLEECINKTIKGFKAFIKEQTDTKQYKIGEYINHKFKRNTAKQLVKEWETINLDDFIEFMDNLKKDTIYFKEGEFGEK